MRYTDFKTVIKPCLIITIAILIASILVAMIAYANCEEARIFMDKLLENPIIANTTNQA